MTLDITPDEQRVLLELLESSSREKLHEIHHTFSFRYRQMLRERLEIIERLSAKLGVHAA